MFCDVWGGNGAVPGIVIVGWDVSGSGAVVSGVTRIWARGDCVDVRSAGVLGSWARADCAVMRVGVTLGSCAETWELCGDVIQ